MLDQTQKTNGQDAQPVIAAATLKFLTIGASKAILGQGSISAIAERFSQLTNYASLAITGNVVTITIEPQKIGKGQRLKDADFPMKGKSFDFKAAGFTKVGKGKDASWQTQFSTDLLWQIFDLSIAAISAVPSHKLSFKGPDVMSAIIQMYRTDLTELTKALMNLTAATVTTAAKGDIIVSGQKLQIQPGDLTMLDFADGKKTVALGYTGQAEVFGMLIEGGHGQTNEVTKAALYDVMGTLRTEIMYKDGTLTFGTADHVDEMPMLKTLTSILYQPNTIGEPTHSIEVGGQTVNFHQSAVLSAIVEQDRVAEFRTVDSIIVAAKAGTLPGYIGKWTSDITDLALSGEVIDDSVNIAAE